MTNRAPKGPFNIEVKFEHREDGGLRAYCDSVPGFALSHSDPDLVVEEVAPVLETILSAMFHQKVKVTATEDIAEALGLRTPTMPAFLCDRVYMGQAVPAC